MKSIAPFARRRGIEKAWITGVASDRGVRLGRIGSLLWN